jgi:RHS repeat-associated protein
MQTRFIYDGSSCYVCIHTLLRSRYTGKERDIESGLDHFQFRSYSSTMGRWMSPDPAGMQAVDISNPQSLNRYAYVQNNPVSFVDPLGLDCAYLNNAGDDLEKGGLDQNSNSTECGKNGGYWVDGGLTDYHINANKGTVQLTGTTDGTDQTHASYQDTTLNVGWYFNTMANPFGHMAIGLGFQMPVGMNPRSDSQFNKAFLKDGPNASVPGAIKPQVGGHLYQMAKIPITGMQANMIQNAINESTLYPGNYSLGGQNGCDCGTWAQQMLGDAGINSGPPAVLPGNVMFQLGLFGPQAQWQ